MPAVTPSRRIFDIKRGVITTLGAGVAVNLDIPIPTDSAVGFQIKVTARASTPIASSASWIKAGVVADSGGTPTIQGQQDVVVPIIPVVLLTSNVVVSISGTNLRIAFNDNSADAMLFQYTVELQVS